MGGILSGIFGGKKADTSAVDEQVRLMKQQQETAKAEADRLASESALKATAARRRKAGFQSLIATGLGTSGEVMG